MLDEVFPAPYHRRIVHMRDRRNGEEKIFQKPHQNTIRGDALGNTLTKASVIRKIDSNLFFMSPKEAVFQERRDAGGVIQMNLLSDLPR